MSIRRVATKNDFGSLYVELEKNSYSTGDTITGWIKQDFKSNYKFSALYLEIVAYERVTLFCNEKKVQSAYGYSSKPQQKGTETNFLINHQFCLNSTLFASNCNEEFEKGQYQIPFKFNLDESMPSSFWEHWTYQDSIGSAYTCYRIKARLESYGKGLLLPTLKQEIKFHVDNRTKLYPAKDLNYNITSRGLLLCTNGRANITVNLDKERYKPGEYVNLNIDIDNSRSQGSIKDIKAKVFQITSIKSNQQKKLTNLVNKLIIVNANVFVKARSRKQVKIAIPLGSFAGTMNTTCEGKLIKNDYQICLKFIYSKFVKSKILCFTKNPTIKFNLNLYNVPEHKESSVNNQDIFEDWNPRILEVFSCNFLDEYRTDNNYLTDVMTDKDNENERYETEIAIL